MTYTYIIDEKIYTFVCKTVTSGYGFSHNVIMHVDGYPVARATKRYENRTWETFPYQQAMLKAVEKYGNNTLYNIIDSGKTGV
jgi:hypothetical protein